MGMCSAEHVPSASPTPQHWDRFIRSSAKIKSRYEALQIDRLDDNQDRIVDQRLFSKSREEYKKLLAKAMSVCPLEEPWFPLWPVRQRAKPCIRSPIIVLDLPNIRDNFCSSLADWSSTDFLTVAFPRSVYLWQPTTNRTLRFPAWNNPACIKWNPQGTNLFTSCRNGTFKMVEIETQMSQNYNQPSQPSCHTGCFFTTAAFHPTMPILLVGCNKGSMSLYDTSKGLEMIWFTEEITCSITTVAFSCDGKHYAFTSRDSIIGVFALHQKAPIFIEVLAGPSKTLAWHPWKRGCLVVGDCMGYMHLYNVLWSKSDWEWAPEASYQTTRRYSPIVCLSFNPLSAELVVSHRILVGSLEDDTAAFQTQLNVLTSFDRVVDRLEGHTGRVTCLNWSPDGKKLATSGTDETARVWEFFPQSKKRETTKKKPRKMSYASASLEIANCFGLTLR